MAFSFPGIFKSKVKKLKKITGAPSTTIKRWCLEKTKQITPDPSKPFNKKSIKDKILKLPSLQKLLIQLKNKVNEIIDEMDMVPELEEKIYVLEKKVFELNIKLEDLNKKHIKDVDSLENMDEELEEGYKSADASADRRFGRHKHQYGRTGWNPYTGATRTYTKKPRRGFFEEGGRVQSDATIKIENINDNELIVHISSVRPNVVGFQFDIPGIIINNVSGPADFITDYEGRSIVIGYQTENPIGFDHIDITVTYSGGSNPNCLTDVTIGNIDATSIPTSNNSDCDNIGNITAGLYSQNNLMGAPLHLENSTFENVFADIQSAPGMGVTGIITEGGAASYQNGMWVGSIDKFEPNKGYWIITEGGFELSLNGFLNDIPYNLVSGPNLISFGNQINGNATNSVPIERALCGGTYPGGGRITGVIGQGGASVYMDNQETWVGSLNNLERNKGYWVMVDSNIPNFSFNPSEQCPEESSRFKNRNFNLPVLDENTNINEYFLSMQNQLNGGGLKSIKTSGVNKIKTDYEAGGHTRGSRTKPKPLSKSEREKLINDILNNG